MMTRQVDFTVMYAAHDAFRRDTDRLRDAAAAGAGADPAVLKGWRTFRRELHLHHMAEDTVLWPRLRVALTAVSGPAAAGLSVLDAMEAEHRRLGSLLDGVEEALTGTGRGVLVQRAEGLAIALDDHLEHEEEAALPLIQAVLRRRTGVPSKPPGAACTGCAAPRCSSRGCWTGHRWPSSAGCCRCCLRRHGWSTARSGGPVTWG